MTTFNFAFDSKEIDHIYFALICYRDTANKKCEDDISALLRKIENKLYEYTVDKETGDSQVENILVGQGL